MSGNRKAVDVALFIGVVSAMLLLVASVAGATLLVYIEVFKKWGEL